MYINIEYPAYPSPQPSPAQLEIRNGTKKDQHQSETKQKVIEQETLPEKPHPIISSHLFHTNQSYHSRSDLLLGYIRFLKGSSAPPHTSSIINHHAHGGPIKSDPDFFLYGRRTPIGIRGTDVKLWRVLYCAVIWIDPRPWNGTSGLGELLFCCLKRLWYPGEGTSVGWFDWLVYPVTRSSVLEVTESMRMDVRCTIHCMICLVCAGG